VRVLRKLSKIEVHYGRAEGHKRCGNCSMYRKGTCTLVAGDIRRNDVCDRWEAKK
jgi:hypothetical protein